MTSGSRTYAPAAPSNGAATAGMTLGIVGAVFGIIPLTGFIAFILGVLALIFGIAGRRKVTRGETDRGKGAATAGIVLGLVAAGLGVWGMVIVFGAVDQFSNDLEEIGSLARHQLT